MIERRYYSLEDASHELKVPTSDIHHGIETGQIKVETRVRSFHLDGSETELTRNKALYVELSTAEAMRIFSGEQTEPFETRGWSDNAVDQLITQTGATREEILRNDAYASYIGRISRYGYPEYPLIIAASELKRLLISTTEHSSKEISERTEVGYLRLIGALTHALAEHGGPKFGSPEKPNIKAIYDTFIGPLAEGGLDSTDKNGSKIPGLSYPTVAVKIRNAMAQIYRE